MSKHRRLSAIAVALFLLVLGSVAMHQAEILPMRWKSQKIEDDYQNDCSVVEIKIGKSGGTGFVYAKNRVITARHVVLKDVFNVPYDSIYVKIKGLWRRAELINVSSSIRSGKSTIEKEGDVALLKVDTDDIFPLLLADSSVTSGENVFWYQYGCQKFFAGAVKWVKRNTGFSLRREGFWYTDFVSTTADYITVDKPFLPGTSGSPILNEKGRVVGIVVSANWAETESHGISIFDPSFIQTAQEQKNKPVS